jgi:hypothetical protein
MRFIYNLSSPVNIKVEDVTAYRIHISLDNIGLIPVSNDKRVFVREEER